MNLHLQELWLHKDIEYLHSNGLALGASLNNCIGLTDTAVANPEGLRCSDEFVRHKVLDCVGDLFCQDII